MEKIIEFIGNNYVWFLTIVLLLLFALIGYIYDSKKNKSDLLTKKDEVVEEPLEKEEDKNNNLSTMIDESNNINQETVNVESTENIVLDNAPKEETTNEIAEELKPEMPAMKEDKQEIKED